MSDALENSPPSLAPRSRRWARYLLQAAVLAAVIYFVARVLGVIDWQDLVARVTAAQPVLVTLAVGCLLGRFFVWDIRWRLAFARLAPVPGFLHSFFSLLGAVCANLVTPSARVLGGLLRARYVSRHRDLSFGRVFGVVLFDQVAHQVIMVTTTWLAIIAMAWVFGHLWFAGVAALLLSVAGVVFDVWIRQAGDGKDGRLIRFFARRAERHEGRLETVMSHGREAIEVLKRLLTDATLRRLAILLGLAFFALNCLALWIIFLALDRSVSLLAVVVAVALGTAIGALTGTPGGVGTTEAGLIFTLVALEVPEVDAVAATVLYRGLHYALVLGLGLPAIAVFELEARARKRTDPQGARAVTAESPHSDERAVETSATNETRSRLRETLS